MEPSTDILKRLLRIIKLHKMFNYHHVDHHVGHHMGHPPFHPSQFPILAWIGDHEGCTQADIAQHLMIKPSTVAISIRRLEKARHIKRMRDESDKRIWRVYLSEQAKSFKQRMSAHIMEEMDVMLQGFDQQDIEQLQGFLKRIQDNLEQNVNEQESTP